MSARSIGIGAIVAIILLICVSGFSSAAKNPPPVSPKSSSTGTAESPDRPNSSTGLTPATPQEPGSPLSKILTIAPQSTVRYGEPWRPSNVEYSNARELIFVTPAKQGEALSARILITTEQRLNHDDALQQLSDIGKSRSGKLRFLEIGGWPAVIIEFVEPLPTRGAPQRKEGRTSEPAPDSSPIQRAIVAVASGSSILHFDISLAPDAPQKLLQQAEEIASSSVFREKGNPNDVHKSILDLQRSVMKPGAPEKLAPAPETSLRHEDLSRFPKPPTSGMEESSKERGSAVSVESGVGELEVVASTNAKDIVIASNGALAYSNDRGSQFKNGSTGAFGLNDPTLARGASGNFYLGVIAIPSGTSAQQNVTGCTNAVSRSVDRGSSFSLEGYGARCPQTGGSICFPDQPHIAADSLNAASGKDQIYTVWRNFVPSGKLPSTCGGIGSGFVTASITCSKDNGATWTSTAAIQGAGDFPRVAVGKDGNVYVVTLSGNNVLLNRFSSCSSGLAPAAGFPVTVATLTGPVACPVPGLDRCNNGNTLSSPTVAPDPSDASHIFVSFAQTDGVRGEQIITAASTNNGSGFPKQSIVTTSKSIRRFMPWSCVTQGRAFVGWYDRQAAKASGATNDLTDYWLSSANGSQVGGSFNLSNHPDPQCASGWPCAPRSKNDSESCTVQPQLAGNCQNASGGGSQKACDFISTTCPSGESCQTGGGCPKYGDYNGIACADNFVVAAWSSATAPQGLPAVTGLNIFSSTITVGPVCSAYTDCGGVLSISCTGPDIGVTFNGNCHNPSGEPTACVAGFNGSSSVSAGGTVEWAGSITSPNSAQACTQDGPFQNCVTVTTPVAPLCPGSDVNGPPPGDPCFSGLGENELWCAKLRRCVSPQEYGGICGLTPIKPPQ